MNARFLEPEAYYDNLDYPIHLPRNLSALQIKVDQPEDAPVIDIDSDGTITGLRRGKAVITAGFGGMTDQVMVIVN